jgi:NadR type nicotinamide-nucleotide adenylyltransferase
LIHVVVTGSECTGKTTLAEALATHFGAACVPEFVRQFVADKGTAPDVDDVDAIARGQMALEDDRSRGESALLVHDTDLLSTVVYSRHYYGDCPDWVEPALRDRAADLYLLAGIDVPWVADGDQRDRGNRRAEMHALFVGALISRRLPFIELVGNHEQRLSTAISTVDRLLRPSNGSRPGAAFR